MESTASHIEAIYDKAKAYTETSIALYKLNAIDKTADIVSSIVSWLALGSIVVVFILFINIGISLYIGELLQANYLGFLIVSSFYLVLGTLLYIFNGRLISKPITNLVISKLMRAKKEDILIPNITEDDEENK
ncbi:hypothetical protein IMCC3317_03410 [Kordia antarctica]|uniref:Holin-X, holin superfamily III n=1 Tax=Kordia antarctica TaxID=1218801 RepID=A0A7L4ZED3_9FLAO|nr:hypothetical protein [Kordia antarctica]QHI34995.1 hypothetical protein IMCC3317_03410 [Kordia antarctica]